MFAKRVSLFKRRAVCGDMRRCLVEKMILIKKKTKTKACLVPESEDVLELDLKLKA